MEIWQGRSKHELSEKTGKPLDEPERLAQVTLPPKEYAVRQSILSIDEQKYQMLVPFIKPLRDPKNATGQEKTGLAKRIFETIAIGGALGMVYDYNSDKRPTKTPEDVLTKDKGAYKADCDELAFTFLAIAKKAGLDIRSFQFIELTFEVKSKEGKKTDEKHAAVVQIDDSTYLLELTRPKDGFSQLPDATLDSLKKYYIGKKMEGTSSVIVNVKSLTPRTTENEIEASFHAERARVLSNQGNILAAISEYETVLGLDKKHEGVADKLVELYFTAAEKYAKTEADKEACYKKAVETAPESFRANFQMGAFYFSVDKFFKAELYFIKALEIRPNDEETLHNVIICYEKIGDANKQLLYSKILVGINPQHPTAYFGLSRSYENLAIGYAKDGNKNEAKKLLQNAIDYCNEGLKFAKDPLDRLDLMGLKKEIEQELKNLD